MALNGLFCFLSSLNFSPQVPGVCVAASCSRSTTVQQVRCCAAPLCVSFEPLHAGAEVANASPFPFYTPCGIFPLCSVSPSACF